MNLVCKCDFESFLTYTIPYKSMPLPDEISINLRSLINKNTLFHHCNSHIDLFNLNYNHSVQFQDRYLAVNLQTVAYLNTHQNHNMYSTLKYLNLPAIAQM